MSDPGPPLGLLAELTHRCPLHCPYCSNPSELERRSAELDTDTWLRVFAEAAALGVLHVHLSGGEPAARADLATLTRGAAQAGLYSNLITSGIGLDRPRLEELAAAGLDHVQLSVQDAEEAEADRIAGLVGAFRHKREVARAVVATGLPLTLNVVLHRFNVERAGRLVAEAAELGARRVEIAHAQYYGWALRNRAALLPRAEQAAAARQAVEAAAAAFADVLTVDYVAPDHFARYPKPCLGGWGRRSLVVTPSGAVLPCHAAQTLPGLAVSNVRDQALGEIWASSPAFAAFRGTGWMREPCSSCPRKEIDFGGCRCQAFALTGDARNTDPACHLSPQHGLVRRIAEGEADEVALPRSFASRAGAPEPAAPG